MAQIEDGDSIEKDFTITESVTVTDQPESIHSNSCSKISTTSQGSSSKFGAWSQLWTQIVFQRMFLLSIVRLLSYLNKISKDAKTVQKYSSTNQSHYLAISIVSMISPPLIYSIFLTVGTLDQNLEAGLSTVLNKFINGLMLSCWQIKRHLDCLMFASQRLFFYRRIFPDERSEVISYNHKAKLLQFFEDFYAGFLQMILQIYILAFSIEIGEKESLLPKHSLVIGEMIASSICIFFMLLSIQRKDDGIITLALSYIGQFSLIVSRVIVFALAFSVLGYLFSCLALVHVLGFTIWIVILALRTYQTPDAAIPGSRSRRRGKNPLALFILTLFFFGIPSLMLWPVMFQLKEHKRPLIFLLICTVENILLLLTWYFLKKTQSTMDLPSLLIVSVGTIIGDLFLFLYQLLKPSLTDQIVLKNMQEDDYEIANYYGIYFEFCNIVFRLDVTEEFKDELKVVECIIDKQNTTNNNELEDNTLNIDTKSKVK